MTRPLPAALLGGILLLCLGCNGSDAPLKPKPSDKANEAPKGLKDLVVEDKKIGTGKLVKEGDVVFVVYTGRLENGRVFDTNDKKDGNPYSFVVGGSQAIRGMDQGVSGMRVGGERHLKIPSRMAYGSISPPGSTIPPNSDLYYDVKLTDAVVKGEENVVDLKDLKLGTGAVAEKGDTVTIHYVGTYSNGRRFDSTYERNKPITFRLGADEVIVGLDYGVTGMKVGGKRKMRLPPNVAYGEYGFNMVAGNAIVHFEVDLLKVNKG